MRITVPFLNRYTRKKRAALLSMALRQIAKNAKRGLEKPGTERECLEGIECFARVMMKETGKVEVEQ